VTETHTHTHTQNRKRERERESQSQTLLLVGWVVPLMYCILQLEDELLSKLSSAEGDLTEDVALIESLEESKRVADEIGEKVDAARRTEEMINEARNKVTFPDFSTTP
jgi:hypothetical protein